MKWAEYFGVEIPEEFKPKEAKKGSADPEPEEDDEEPQDDE